MLLCYNYHNGIIDEKHIISTTQLKLFSIRTISLFETIQSMKTTNVEIIDRDVKTIVLEHELEVQNTMKKIAGNKYEPEVILEDKVYLKTYYNN